MRKIVAIQVNTNPARYVSDLSPRPDRSNAVLLTENKNEAMDFGTVSGAEMAIKRFHNPLDRSYTIVNISVLQPARPFDQENRLN